MHEPTTYPVHSRYLMFFIVCLALTLLFGWSLWQTPTIQTGFFCIVCLGAALWYGQMSLSSVTVTDNALAYDSLLRKRREIEFRQLIEVSESGRFGQSIMLLYYPLLATGLVDLEDAQSLFLPQVIDQETLHSALVANIR
ncbi:MAG: hypothetical protein AAF639_25580 [Chloroflexota bacterium]